MRQRFPEPSARSSRAGSPCPTGFGIPGEGLSEVRRSRLLGDLEAFLVDRRRHTIGFQGNLDIEHYRRDLAGLLGVHLNNVGDPFQDGDYPLHTKPVERAVLDHYARLWRAEHPGASRGAGGGTC